MFILLLPMLRPKRSKKSSKLVTVQVWVDRKLKERVERILKSIGLDVPTAIRMFFVKVDEVGGIPFEMKNPRLARPGLYKNMH